MVRHVIGCRVTQEHRFGVGLADSSRRVIGCQMPCDARNEGSQCVTMTWRAVSALDRHALLGVETRTHVSMV